MDILDFINAKVEEGIKEPKFLRAYATLEGFSDKEVTVILKELGLSRSKAEGLTYPDILSYLGEDIRTEKELADFILENATKNEARWFSDRNKIRILTNKIHLKYSSEPFTDVLVDTDTKKALKDRANSK